MDKEYIDEYGDLPLDNWWLEGRRSVVAAGLQRLGIEPDGSARRLLDVGCGSGSMMPVLTPLGHVTGIDASGPMIGKCRERFPDVELRQTDSLDALLGGRDFDIVTAFDVVEHVEDDSKLAGELASLVVRGGLVVVTVPAYQWMWGDHDVLSGHHRRYLKRELIALFSAAGVEVLYATYFNTLLFPAAAAARIWHRIRGRRGRRNSDFASVPRWSERWLSKIFSFESRLVRRTSLPFGVSILLVGRVTG